MGDSEDERLNQLIDSEIESSLSHAPLHPGEISAQARKDVQLMLGGRTPAEFVALPRSERDTVYRIYLTQADVVRVEEGFDEEDDLLNPGLDPRGAFLRQQWAVGDDAAGKQIAREAREIYYMQNAFTVPLHWLGEFVHDCLADGGQAHRIEPLLRRITVRVPLRHLYDEGSDRPHPGGKPSHTVQDLQRLVQCTEAQEVGVEIVGGGMLDGSDLRTQQLIQDISSIVKDLISKFGSGFRIIKTQPRPAFQHSQSYDLRPYWNPPSPATMQRLRRGQAGFLEVMQVQIDAWTQRRTRIGPEDAYYRSVDFLQ